MVSLQVKRPETLKEQIYKTVKSLLTSGKLDQDTFYSANHFAEKLGVSRTPVREALLQLETEGYLVAEDNRGFRIKKFSAKEARDFFEMRKLMETHAIGKLCDALTSEDLKALEDNVKLMRAASHRDNAAQFVSADEGFHLVSISRCDNSFLATLVKNIRDFIFIFGRSVVEREAAMQEVVAEHEQILKALKAGDRTRAVDAMASHLENTERRLLRSQAE